MLTKFFVPLSKSGFYTKRVSKSINNSLHSLTQRAVVGSDQRLSSSNFCFESVEIEYCFYVAHAKGFYILLPLLYNLKLISASNILMEYY